jgi:hypothetical protein
MDIKAPSGKRKSEGVDNCASHHTMTNKLEVVTNAATNFGLITRRESMSR